MEKWELALKGGLEWALLIDYHQLVELDPSVRPKMENAQERVKEQLVAMARNAGNTVLGWFGMSMDDIKVDYR
jgi:hypothetical protein